MRIEKDFDFTRFHSLLNKEDIPTLGIAAESPYFWIGVLASELNKKSKEVEELKRQNDLLKGIIEDGNLRSL